MKSSFTRLRWPVGWETDVLRELHVFVAAKAERDARLSEVLLRTVTPVGFAAVRVPELLPRTVWRQEADSELPRTDLQRVRGDKLRHSESGSMRRVREGRLRRSGSGPMRSVSNPCRTGSASGPCWVPSSRRPT